MKYKSIVFKIVLAGFFLILSCAPKHNFIINSQSGVPVDPDIVYGHLPNGFQYILMEN
ncbi:MAG: hypothetical protein GY857_12405, partial [Desulfobacula sp.]|nr:hypothetical protein [Desulfobacula sp.]